MPTPTTYTFVQKVDYPSVLQSTIQSSSIAVSLASIGTVGSGSSMVVSINFNDVLSSADQTTLDSIMSAYINTAPPATVPSVIQILGADSVSICPFGTMFSAPTGQTTTYDLEIPNQVYLKGGVMYSSPGNVGDTLTVQVVDKSNITGQGGTSENPTVLATYVNNWYVIPEDMNGIEDVSLSMPMIAGLYIRFIYTNSGTNACQVIVNLIAYQGIE
jgi:hypothetical protein